MLTLLEVGGRCGLSLLRDAATTYEKTPARVSGPGLLMVVMGLRSRGVFVVVEGFLRDDDGFWLLDGELELRLAVVIESSADRNQVTHDDVFFETAEVIDASESRCFSEDTGGVLEGSGGDERVGFQRGFGDAKENWRASG